MLLIYTYSIFIGLALAAFFLGHWLYELARDSFGLELSMWLDRKRNELEERKRHSEAKSALIEKGYDDKLADFLADHEDLEPLYAKRKIFRCKEAPLESGSNDRH